MPFNRAYLVVVYCGHDVPEPAHRAVLSPDPPPWPPCVVLELEPHPALDDLTGLARRWPLSSRGGLGPALEVLVRRRTGHGGDGRLLGHAFVPVVRVTE